MNILYLSHCVPNPPDKGEKIRAYQELQALTKVHRVHLVCFARSEQEVRHAHELRGWCESVYVQVLPSNALIRALFRFATGASINMALFESGPVNQYITRLGETVHFDVAVAYTLVMASYIPPNTLFLLDMVDVDSEKWFQYGDMRKAGLLYRMEARRLRHLEIEYSKRAEATVLTTGQEMGLLRSFASPARLEHIENGVNSDLFNPATIMPIPSLSGRRYIVFVGTMDYYPNVDAARWFAREIFPDLRKQAGDLEFLIVGNRPSRAARELASITGVTVTGHVPDVRPYVLGSRAVVAPLRLARGIQNKVLEALAMERCVYASPAVCRTFGAEIPSNVVCCESDQDYITNIVAALESRAQPTKPIREEILQRFNWDTNMAQLLSLVEEIPKSKRRAERASLVG